MAPRRIGRGTSETHASLRAASAELSRRIATRVRERRLELGLTQQALAGDVMTKAHVSALELGYTLPSLTTLVWLAERLEMSPSALLAEDSSTWPSPSGRISAVAIEHGRVVCTLQDGRVVGVPLTISERLAGASWAELASAKIASNRRSVSWPALDVTLGLDAFFPGPPARAS